MSRALLAELLPHARFVSRCPSCGGDHGRVRVEGADAAVSVSYAAGWALVATTRAYARLGVDAVPAAAAGLERVLPGGGDARQWARVEAVLKADGRGLAVDPDRVEFLAAGATWTARVRADQAAHDPEPVEGIWLGEDLDAPAGIVAALAVGGERAGPAGDTETVAS